MIVYTTVFGRTDPLHEPKVRGSARFVCFTDQPIESANWEMVRLPKQDAPTRASRLTKALSHIQFPEVEWTLWMDANFTLLVDPESLKQHGEFVNFVHPARTRITDEAEAIIRLRKAKEDATRRQLAAYHAEGFDTDANPMTVLSCDGVILRRHTEAVKAVNEAWAQELRTHTLRDQMSLDYVCWKQGLSLSRWPGSHKDNPYFHHTHYNRPVNDY